MSHVNLNRVVPMLMCDDVGESIDFYTNVLGFEVRQRMDDVGKSGWAYLTHAAAHLMLASPHDSPDGVKIDGKYPQTVYYFYPDDVEALHRSVRDQDYATSDLRVTFYGMKEFEMNDPSGHVLLFGQDTDEGQAA